MGNPSFVVGAEARRGVCALSALSARPRSFPPGFPETAVLVNRLCQKKSAKMSEKREKLRLHFSTLVALSI
jgi:hypothetical protein